MRYRFVFEPTSLKKNESENEETSKTKETMIENSCEYFENWQTAKFYSCHKDLIDATQFDSIEELKNHLEGLAKELRNDIPPGFLDEVVEHYINNVDFEKIAQFFWGRDYDDIFDDYPDKYNNDEYNNDEYNNDEYDDCEYWEQMYDFCDNHEEPEDYKNPYRYDDYDTQEEYYDYYRQIDDDYANYETEIDIKKVIYGDWYW
ncbi:MAG: hypothetical protein EWV88_04340 [Microcystis wesenbergii Mw_MB_S_20031200_S109D]|uniref:Uncharacterized protein n=1 Tax=Microcystis wesenbergii Mw_MB_S_20031200_S109D TaxID=2486241 RepID=A0A552M5H6_9CHRO|nr:MAG: hypothetical protein EWV88_04340 [Microcystis wesenbergii Mw_MB_S_20031200_S109D]